jgi:enamine deaminase RidA (YjgF/YER057c/UK114 family)
MSIIRHKSPVQDGRPIISKVVEHAGIVYLCGILPDPVGDITAQTRQVLERIDEALRLAGTTKSKLLTAQVWLADMRLFEAHNAECVGRSGECAGARLRAGRPRAHLPGRDHGDGRKVGPSARRFGPWRKRCYPGPWCCFRPTLRRFSS